MQNWLHNIRKTKCPDIKYLIVPEIHKRIEENGQHAWHFHGLLSNCDNLNIVPSFRKDGKRRVTKSGLERFEIKDYKLGFSDATPIQDTFRVSTYILKYITKAECCVAKGKRRFIYSQNLQKPIETNYYSDSNNLFQDIMDNSDYINLKEIFIGDFQQKIEYYHFNSDALTSSSNKHLANRC